MGYIKFFEKDYKEALLIYQNYLDVAISSQDKENEHSITEEKKDWEALNEFFL